MIASVWHVDGFRGSACVQRDLIAAVCVLREA